MSYATALACMQNLLPILWQSATSSLSLEVWTVFSGTSCNRQLCCICRRKLQQRVWQALADPNIPANSLLARLRDEYGAESEIAADNIITMLFAGEQITLWVLNQCFTEK